MWMCYHSDCDTTKVWMKVYELSVLCCYCDNEQAEKEEWFLREGTIGKATVNKFGF